jgi:ribonuclease D
MSPAMSPASFAKPPQTPDNPAALLYTGAMHVIAETKELAEACKRLALNAYVAVDTEFMRETTFWPQLCLIQLAAPGIALMVDPLAPRLDLAPFYALMADEKVVKVFHAARQDIEIVHVQARIIPHPIFDTQVAAMVCGFGDSISYVNLVKRVTGRQLDKSSRFTDWSRRPLSQKQLAYAQGDVTHLCEIYEHLQADLAKTGREHWLSEEMATLTDPRTYATHPEDAWRRLKIKVRNRTGLAVLIELAAWRERQAQAQDVPRNRVLRDEALYDIANQAPTEVAQLAQLRTLSEGFSRSARAREIIDAVKRGVGRDPKTVPPVPSNSHNSAEASATMDLLRVLLKAAAQRHGVAPRLIADADDLERIALEEAPDVPALSGWRRELFGENALRLKRGELALTVKKGEVTLLPTRVAVA